MASYDIIIMKRIMVWLPRGVRVSLESSLSAVLLESSPRPSRIDSKSVVLKSGQKVFVLFNSLNYAIDYLNFFKHFMGADKVEEGIVTRV